MEKKGKERVYEELEKFVSTRLRPFVHSYKFIENNLLTVEDRLAYMEKACVMQINSALARMNAAVLGSFEMALFNLPL